MASSKPPIIHSDSSFNRLGLFCRVSRNRPEEQGVVCPGPGGEPLYRMAGLSVASRRLPGTTQRKVCPPPLFCCVDTTAHRIAARRDVLGSRLLLTDRAAMLRSGSPPGVGPLDTQRVCNPSVFLSHPSNSGVSELLVVVLANLRRLGCRDQ
jgi:hypothetical protein